MTFDEDSFKAALLEQARQKIEERINLMSCTEHGRASHIRLNPDGESWNVEGLCCEAFRTEVMKALS